MLKNIRYFLKNLDHSQLPSSKTPTSDWTYEQLLIVEKLRYYHQFLWFETDSSNVTANKLLAKLEPFFNCDGGYIYLPGETSQSNDPVA